MKALKLPVFDGEDDKFQMWWLRFICYARVFGFEEALVEGGESDMPLTEKESLDSDTETGKLKIAARKRNSMAMAILTMALSTPGTVALIYDSMEDDD